MYSGKEGIINAFALKVKTIKNKLNMIPLILLIIFTYSIEINSQSKVDLFPAKLNVQPFTANIIEPGAGFFFLVGKEELKLDIGKTQDIFHYNIDERKRISFGADFFTYSRLKSTSEFHFPVDAIDYLFGLNASYNITNDKDKVIIKKYGFRFRLSHISAHLVDGRFDNKIAYWQDSIKPEVYSREFIEIFPYILIEELRIYTGFTYLLHSSPEGIGKDSYQFGFDYYLTDIVHPNVTPFLGYDFKLNNTYFYSGNNSIVAGIKFGTQRGKGIAFRFNYYNGHSFYGQFFKNRVSFSSIGINFEF